MTTATGHDTIISPGGSTPLSRERAVHLANVRKTFGSDKTEVKALRGIDLDVPASTLTMLVGPSGCGKTTLVSIMSGVLDADPGSHAEIFGVEWLKLNNDQRARRRSEIVGFVFQQFNLIPTLTVLENTTVPLLVRGLGDRTARDRATQALTDVGLGDRLSSMPSQLSGGMQQRVAIARALVGRPRLLVCDEPTAALDGKTGQHIMDLIHAASRAGDDQGRPRCVIVVTHDNRIFHYADRIIEMEDGRLKSTLSKHTVEESQHIPTYEEDNNKQGK